MRNAFLLVMVFFGASAVVEAKGNRIDCRKTIEGEDIGGRFEMILSFDSQGPTLVDTLKTTQPGKPLETTTKTHISPKSVCGLNLDFSKDCKVRERLDPRFGYSFNFVCGEEITFGELYCDENCTSAKGSGVVFKCQGPKVDKTTYGTYRTWGGCKFTKVAS